VAPANGLEAMKQYRDDVRERMANNGRNPDDMQVLYITAPIVADTNEEAQAKKKRWFNEPLFIEYQLAEISSITEIDFSQFDLDKPVPRDLTTNGERGALETFLAAGPDKTLRDLITHNSMGGQMDFTGTPDEVAEKMIDVIDTVGGDGFLITSPVMRLNRRYVTEITDGLVPALQKRGATRTSYTHTMLRDNLRDF
jgi:alkanesulfonate monooxygenase SsuD/methylene tetrahydromethanopterin reductase-like flavin-dependent oxidoreductase (luciferase family)